MTYYYTDYFVVTAFEMRLLREKALTPKMGRGRKKESRQETAEKFLHNLASRNATDRIRLPKPLFVRLNSPDSLLALMNLHSAAGCYLPSDKVLEAAECRFQVGADGVPAQGTDLSAMRVVQSHMEDILALLDEPGLKIFNTPPWPNRES
mgnify:FL=1